MKNLPPLSQFQAFEAAARHLSFSRSAQELNVQQPAVSRQVAALEEALGAKLFLRSKPRLTLTAEGETLFSAVSAGLAAIRSGAESVVSSSREDVLVVNAAIGFTSLFLLPQLAEFQDRHPDLRLEVVTRDQNKDYDPGQCDIAVVFGEAGAPGMRSARIFCEELIPVCAPGYLPGDTPLPLEALPDHRLLHMSNPHHSGDWARYLKGTGLTAGPPQALDRIHSYMVYLRAIQNGNGIGLGWGRLIDDLVQSGALAVACERSVSTARGYFACITPRAEGRAGTEEFLNWISGLIPGD